MSNDTVDVTVVCITVFSLKEQDNQQEPTWLYVLEAASNDTVDVLFVCSLLSEQNEKIKLNQ